MADIEPSHKPGPMQDDLLYHQPRHISQKLWDEDSNNLDWTIQTRAHPLWGHDQGPSIPESVLSWLHAWGFAGVIRCGTMHIDRHLITALVERWRRETHTFHFRTGEATITLEDVSVLWHLPIDGDAVRASKAEAEIGRGIAASCAFVRMYIGWEAPSQAFKGRSILISHLRKYCIEHVASADTSEPHGLQYARALAWLLMGTVLFPEISGSRVALKFLWLLRDPDLIGQYSWGSAVLANLYRELCLASIFSNNRKDIGGALTLLQVWAWMRMPSIGPRDYASAPGRDARVLSDGTTLPAAPFASVISGANLRWGTTVQHSVRLLRDTIDIDTSFRWQLYPREAYNYITNEGLRDLFRYNGPIFCFDTVEFHWASRVMRQYGMLQTIPKNPDGVLDCVHDSATSRTDWTQLTKDWLRLWQNRHAELSTTAATSTSTCVPDYHDWYDLHTRRFITPSRKYMKGGWQPGHYELLRTIQDSLRAAPTDPSIYKHLADRVDDYLWRGSRDTGEGAGNDLTLSLANSSGSFSSTASLPLVVSSVEKNSVNQPESSRSSSKDDSELHSNS